jgi:hypothetical protein
VAKRGGVRPQAAFQHSVRPFSQLFDMTCTHFRFPPTLSAQAGQPDRSESLSRQE